MLEEFVTLEQRLKLTLSAASKSATFCQFRNQNASSRFAILATFSTSFLVDGKKIFYKYSMTRSVCTAIAKKSRSKTNVKADLHNATFDSDSTQDSQSKVQLL